MKRLENKTAVIYGAGGVGSAVAKAFVREGAKVFLAGHDAAKLNEIKKSIAREKGTIEVTELDALDEKAVEAHMVEIISKTGKIDISFNAIGLAMTGIQGIPLLDIPVENFFLPIATYTRSHLITAQAAAKRMIPAGKGVILIHTPSASRAVPPFIGGMAPTWAAMEALGRGFSTEWAPKGVRTVCLMTTGMPDTPLIDEVWSIHGESHGVGKEEFNSRMQGQTQLGRLTTLPELSSAAIFAASDEGSSITGSTFNLTGGFINW